MDKLETIPHSLGGKTVSDYKNDITFINVLTDKKVTTLCVLSALNRSEIA